MITYKTLPNSGRIKTGMNASFTNDGEGLKINITRGSLSKDGNAVVLIDEKILSLKTSANLDVNFCAMLAKKISDGTIDIVVVQSTHKSRGYPLLPSKGYDCVEVIGYGVVKAGNATADGVEFMEYDWA